MAWQEATSFITDTHTAIITATYTDVTTVNLDPSHPIDAQIYYLNSKSLEDASLPLSWKEAIITTIFTKGDRKLPNNYHPISLTSI